MSWATFARTTLVCAGLIVLNYTLRPLLDWRASIDFLIIALMFGAVRMRPGLAAMYGFTLGMIADSSIPSGFGAAALGMSIVGFAASWLKAVFFADHPALNAFFLFLGKWVFDAIFLFAGHRAPASEMVMQLVVWSPLSAAVTAVAGSLILALIRPMMEMRTA